MKPSDPARSAYDAIKNKDAPLARQLLREILESAAKNEIAWHLYAHVAQSPHEAIYCLQKTLELNSLNDEARQELAKLQNNDPQATPGQQVPGEAGSESSPIDRSF